METTGRTTAPLRLTEFATPKDSGGLTEASADGNLMLILAVKRMTRKLFWQGTFWNHHQNSD